MLLLIILDIPQLSVEAKIFHSLLVVRRHTLRTFPAVCSALYDRAQKHKSSVVPRETGFGKATYDDLVHSERV